MYFYRIEHGWLFSHVFPALEPDLIDSLNSKLKQMTTYKVKNDKNNAVVTEYWDNEPVRKYRYKVPYNGGCIILFMQEHERYLVSTKTNFAALRRYCNI